MTIPTTASKTQASTLLELDGVSKAFDTRAGERVFALAEICLAMNEGEFVAVIGPSGCGKTTLLKILAGIHPATRGSIRINGSALETEPQVGIVFQTPVLMPWLSIIDNVLLPALVQGRDIHGYRRRAQALLELVELNGFEGKYPGELSGGMQQRASLVRALLTDPAILLMDEPFAALDALTRERMGVELQRIWLATGKTVFFITHGINEAVFLADRVVVMSARPGRIIADIAIPFARPRLLELANTPPFGELTRRIRSLLDRGHQ